MVQTTESKKKITEKTGHGAQKATTSNIVESTHNRFILYSILSPTTTERMNMKKRTIEQRRSYRRTKMHG
jgi:hypothetical protein